jgi:hypothetical protein
MPPITPNPRKIKTFRTVSAFEKWLRTNHSREAELWLRIYKKHSGVPTITAAQAAMQQPARGRTPLTRLLARPSVGLVRRQERHRSLDEVTMHRREGRDVRRVQRDDEAFAVFRGAGDCGCASQ